MDWGVIKYTQSSTQFITLFFFIMSKSIALSLLAQGNTGSEILSILDVIASENVSEVDDNQPTLNEIDFWC